MGRSDKKTKSTRINALRKQYDAFLEEDKKRKERNEYILEKLDKMRYSNALVKVNPGKTPCGAEIILQNRVVSPGDRLLIQPTLNNSDAPSLSSGESIVLKELSKKYIIIPKRLSNSYTQPNPEPDICEFKTTETDGNDWKSKYDILDKLKNYEKGESFEKSTTINYNNKENKNFEDIIENTPQLLVEEHKISEVHDTEIKESDVKLSLNNKDLKNNLSNQAGKLDQDSSYQKDGKHMQENYENYSEVDNRQYPILSENLTASGDVGLQDTIYTNPQDYNYMALQNEITPEHDYVSAELTTTNTEQSLNNNDDAINQYAPSSQIHNQMDQKLSYEARSYKDIGATDTNNEIEIKPADENIYGETTITQVNNVDLGNHPDYTVAENVSNFEINQQHGEVELEYQPDSKLHAADYQDNTQLQENVSFNSNNLEMSTANLDNIETTPQNIEGVNPDQYDIQQDNVYYPEGNIETVAQEVPDAAYGQNEEYNQQYHYYDGNGEIPPDPNEYNNTDPQYEQGYLPQTEGEAAQPPDPNAYNETHQEYHQGYVQQNEGEGQIPLDANGYNETNQQYDQGYAQQTASEGQLPSEPVDYNETVQQYNEGYEQQNDGEGQMPQESNVYDETNQQFDQAYVQQYDNGYDYQNQQLEQNFEGHTYDQQQPEAGYDEQAMQSSNQNYSDEATKFEAVENQQGYEQDYKETDSKSNVDQ